MTIFGQFGDSSFAEEAMLNRLKQWLPIYLANVDQAHGLPPGFTETPNSWDIGPALDLTENPHYPLIYLVSPGSNEPGAREGDGSIRMTYALQPVAIVKSIDALNTNALLKRYTTAIQTCIMNKRSLGDPNVFGTDFDGTDNLLVSVEERRTIQGVMLRFSVTYRHVASTYLGPGPGETDPATGGPTDPQATDPTVPYEDRLIIPDIDHTGLTLTKKQ